MASLLSAAVRIRNFLVFSMYMRFLYFILFCLLIGFVVPLLVDEFAFDDDGEGGDSNIVTGTCHIEVGMRTNCMPDYEEDDITEVMPGQICQAGPAMAGIHFTP